MRWVLPAAVLGGVVVLLASCSSDAATPPSTTRTEPTTTEPAATVVPATVPPVPSGVQDCGTQNDLAGWPTTMVASPDAYDCIVDALAAGTPAQMSSITASDGDSGRTTGDGYDIPTRQIVTWVVLGPGQVEETVDRTEDGGTVTTQTCTGFTEAAFAVPIAGTACS